MNPFVPDAAQATPVPATPVPATPVPATPVPATPVDYHTELTLAKLATLYGKNIKTKEEATTLLSGLKNQFVVFPKTEESDLQFLILQAVYLNKEGIARCFDFYLNKGFGLCQHCTFKQGECFITVRALLKHVLRCIGRPNDALLPFRKSAPEDEKLTSNDPISVGATLEDMKSIAVALRGAADAALALSKAAEQAKLALRKAASAANLSRAVMSELMAAANKAEVDAYLTSEAAKKAQEKASAAWLRFKEEEHRTTFRRSRPINTADSYPTCEHCGKPKSAMVHICEQGASVTVDTAAGADAPVPVPVPEPVPVPASASVSASASATASASASATASATASAPAPAPAPK